jgi:DNA-binding HxlR family transcriptional regulator
MEQKYLCAFEYAIERINGKWKGKVLKYLNERTYRFNELHRELDGISQKMLSKVLSELEKDGIVLKKVYPIIPPKVEYSLTEQGKKLEKIFILLSIWGEELAKINGLDNIKCHLPEKGLAKEHKDKSKKL